MLLYAGLGMVAWFVVVWLRHDWDTAMKTPPGRAMSWTKSTTKTGVNEQARRERAKRGLYEEDHLAKEATEVIQIDHDKQRSPRAVIVCAKDKGMAYARVASSLQDKKFQILPKPPVDCDIATGRKHCTYELRKRMR